MILGHTFTTHYKHEQWTTTKIRLYFSTYDGCAELAVSVLVPAAGALGGGPGVVEDEERRDLHRGGGHLVTVTQLQGDRAICSPALRCRP